MKFHYALLALVVACTGDVTDDKSGDTGPAGDDDDIGCGAGGPYDGPLTITGADVTCTGDSVRFTLETQGITADGVVFSQETANVEPQWADNHTIVSTERDDDCDTFDHLERDLEDGSSLSDPVNDWQRDQSSVFQCDAHYNDESIMTYAFAVYDPQGVVADCLAFGDDVTGMKNGSYDIAGENPDFDLSGCRAGTEGL